MFTFLLALLALLCFEYIVRKKTVLNYCLGALTTIVFCVLALVLKTDYNFLGIVLVMVFYLLRDQLSIVRNGAAAIYICCYEMSEYTYMAYWRSFRL